MRRRREHVGDDEDEEEADGDSIDDISVEFPQPERWRPGKGAVGTDGVPMM